MGKEKSKKDLLPLVQRSFDLCVVLSAQVNRFPRAHKSLLGRDLLTAAQALLGGLIRASRRRERKTQIIQIGSQIHAPVDAR